MRAGLTYAKLTVSWRLWAFGWHDYLTKSRKYRVFCLAFGPLRLHFIDWGSKHWRRIKEEETKYREFIRSAATRLPKKDTLSRPREVSRSIQPGRQRTSSPDSSGGEARAGQVECNPVTGDV